MPKGVPAWQPAGVKELETNAEAVARSVGNTLVVAGPGAGKTEVLAQRADYLLRTRTCRAPHRILAISFKRDAAKNLADRVARRLPAGLATQLDSWTFDAFSKQLLDRFHLAIEPAWRPTSNYVIDFTISEDRAGNAIEAAGPAIGMTAREMASIDRSRWYRQHFIGGDVLGSTITPDKSLAALAQVAWKQLLTPGSGPSRLNFPMIARLAQRILQTNPMLLKALRLTYRYVFLDEFQDTTGVQYDLLRTSFLGSNSVVTAVGDPKQSIMVWAGALRGVMQTYAEEFSAEPIPLLRNYRSAPELVEILAQLAVHIDPHAAKPEAARKDGTEGRCRVFEFSDDAEEALGLANFLKFTIESEGVPPREICVLCRKKVDAYSKRLSQTLSDMGVDFHVRDETRLQDLLSEPVVVLLSDAIRLATTRRSRDSWIRFTASTDDLSPASSDAGIQRWRREISAQLADLRRALATCDTDEDELQSAISPLLTFIGTDALRNRYPQYSQGRWLDEQISAFCRELCYQRLSVDGAGLPGWCSAIDRFEGVGSVPIITIHKSKGLEYDTVIFVGLEDAAFNNMKNADEEGNNFFVAFSRAKNRVLFTFSKQRFGYGQSRKNVERLFSWLSGAGVPVDAVSAGAFVNGLP